MDIAEVSADSEILQLFSEKIQFFPEFEFSPKSSCPICIGHIECIGSRAGTIKIIFDRIPEILEEYADRKQFASAWIYFIPEISIGDLGPFYRIISYYLGIQFKIVECEGT